MTPSKFRDAAGSIAFKQSFILLAMGGATAAAVAVGLFVFANLSRSIERLTTDVLPEIATSLDVVTEAGEMRDSVNTILTASDETALEAGMVRLGDTTADLDAAIRGLSSEASALILSQASQLGAVVARLRDARSQEFAAEERLERQVKGLAVLSEEARGRLTELQDEAFFLVAMGGEETVATVRDTLSGLTEREFGLLQDMLTLRSDVNLVAGLALAMNESRDPALRTILADSVTGGLERVQRLLADVGSDGPYAEPLAPVAEAAQRLAELSANDFRGGSGIGRELISLRQSTEAALSSVVDDMSFALVILGEDVSDSNEQAIRGLLDDQVRRIIDAGAIDTAVSQVLISALVGATAGDAAAAEGAQTALDAALAHYGRVVEDAGLTDELMELGGKIAAIASAETGVVADRIAHLAAIESSVATSAEAARVLAGITDAARAQGEGALASVRDAGTAILSDTRTAGSRMELIAIVSLALFGLAMGLTYWLILRPMRRVAHETERLSSGDLAPVEGFDRTGGEIGRMARALGVFRDGIIARQELETQEKDREERERIAQREAEEQERLAERAALEEEERRARLERDRQAAEEEAKRQAERAAQEERDARAAEQATVVRNLADAMRRLSAGDLTARIDTTFPDAYEDLRRNFNEAVETLADVMSRLTESASAVDASASDIASAANELAGRTERNAASLEETAAAITELDASAQSASGSARDASSRMDDVRVQVGAGSEKMKEAVATMTEIEASSNAIAKITNLIEDIAFQTNLLALNAGVEAARAGEKGLGFAVVATEVRHLAQRSSEAASEINDLITTTRNQISAGVSTVSEAGAGIREILEAIENVSTHVSRIAQSSQEQASTISEIGSAVGGLDQSTQKNAAMFEESLAASQLLKSEAGTLLSLARQFVTDRQGDLQRDVFVDAKVGRQVA